VWEAELADPYIPDVLAEWSSKGYKAVIVTSACNIFAPWRAKQKQSLGIDFISAIKDTSSMHRSHSYEADGTNGILYSSCITGGPAKLLYFGAKRIPLFRDPATIDEAYEVLKRHLAPNSREHVLYFRQYPNEILQINLKGSAMAGAIVDGLLDKPQKMVFIDDNIDNLASVAETCQDQGIAFLGIFYKCQSQTLEIPKPLKASQTAAN
jgi:hypothetical protein